MMAQQKKLWSASTWLWMALVALNVTLLAAIYLRTGDNIARAQTVRPVDLQAVAGRYSINNSPAILYLFDSNSGQLIAVRPGLQGQNAVVLGRQNVFDLFEKLR